jgi:SAM-dependent methyltransferase
MLRPGDANSAASTAGLNLMATDTLELYRWAVQDPETHAIVLSVMYERLRPGLQPAVLREDFAGTSAESVAWVLLQPGRRAIAVDLDAATLEWARGRAVRLIGALASKIAFVRGDSRSVAPPAVPAADIIAVLNYSVFYLHEPAELLAYLRHALSVLAPDGILVLNLCGGPDAERQGITRRHVAPNPRLSTEARIPHFEYQWEVRRFDRRTRRLDGRIHFSVPHPDDPARTRELRGAFRYDWRMWSVPELMEACREAGFTGVQVWRHTYDASKGDAGVFLGSVEPDSLPETGKWIAYIVACR